MTIKSSLDRRFFALVWPSYGILIGIVVPVPAFCEFSAFAAVVAEEINQDHDLMEPPQVLKHFHAHGPVNRKPAQQTN